MLETRQSYEFWGNEADYCDHTQTKEEYLHDLSDEYGVPIEAVKALADVLGDNELYDGLVVELQDAAHWDWS